MKQITRNPNVSRWRYIFSFGKKNNECVPMKATVMEANNKTYLIDRIETLEDRLIQVSFYYTKISWKWYSCFMKIYIINLSYITMKLVILFVLFGNEISALVRNWNSKDITQCHRYINGTRIASFFISCFQQPEAQMQACIIRYPPYQHWMWITGLVIQNLLPVY